MISKKYFILAPEECSSGLELNATELRNRPFQPMGNQCTFSAKEVL